MRVFKDIKIGEVFNHNGTRWIKISSRTAKVHDRADIIKQMPTYYFTLGEVIYPFLRVEDGYYGS